MYRKHLRAAIGVLVAGLAATAGFAQQQPPDAKPDPALQSPFTFAESNKKAAQRIEAEKIAEASGAKVIGGEVAAQGAWPWQVGLMVGNQPVGPDAQFCGGTMILDQWVLTAAHCVYMADDKGGYFQVDPSRFNVLVGTNKLAPGQGDAVPVAAVFRHPQYVGGEFDNDIALIKLARVPSAPYKTIQVPDAALGDILDQPGVPTIVTGWGLITGGQHPDEMYQGEIQVLGRDMCNGAIMEARANYAAKGFSEAAETLRLNPTDAQEAWAALVSRAPLPLSANMICSGTFEGGKTSCSGDSGGPLVVPLDDGSYVQAGVVSWGMSGDSGGCLETAMFSAYTKVANYLPWLEQTIGQN